MTAVTALPWARPLTRADLEQMPDDGHRYELLDGILLVSPASKPLHQRAVLRLAVLLDAMCPDGLEVFTAPLDVVLADDTVLEPDVLVARQADLTDRDLPAVPLLAVEVLSPSTRRIDLLLKHSRLEAAGCPTYWVIDPDEPSLTAWQLVDGRFELQATVTGTERYVTAAPFEVTITPADLIRADRP
jgi:Uma2 family endonuclease